MIPTLTNPLGISPAYGRRLQYLESTGTQYIDTGITPDKDMIADIDCDFTSSRNELQTLFGARVPVPGALNAYIIWNDMPAGQPRFDYGNEYGVSPQSTVTFPITNFRKDGPKNYVNGVLISTNSAVSALVCSNTCRLFAAGGVDDNNGKLAYLSKIKVSRCRIWRDGVNLTMDLIPVLDKNGVPCLFDTVSKTFKYNAGSGTFNYA